MSLFFSTSLFLVRNFDSITMLVRILLPIDFNGLTTSRALNNDRDSNISHRHTLFKNDEASSLFISLFIRLFYFQCFSVCLCVLLLFFFIFFVSLLFSLSHRFACVLGTVCHFPSFLLLHDSSINEFVVLRFGEYLRHIDIRS